ncbi:MAG: hypothetical protein M3Z04_07660 [Chloroflexota bacterium]|nr:hypothetical protein [Chloroflexota bacterium]
MNQQFQISVEELAYALGVLGGVGVAGGFLRSVLGDRDRRELDGRLLSAGHTLMARGYLDLNLVTQTTHIDPALRAAVLPLINNQFSIRCSYAAGNGEQVLAYFSQKPIIIEHKLVQGVISHLDLVPDWATVADRSYRFFDLPLTRADDQGFHPVGNVPINYLYRPQTQENASSPDTLTLQLQREGLLPLIAQQLAQDIVESEAHSSVIRTQTGPAGLTADRGFLILRSWQRWWLLDLQPQNSSVVIVYQGTRSLYNTLFQRLIQ